MRHFPAGLSLRQLHAALDIAYRLQILVDLATIRSAEVGTHRPDVLGDGVEDAAFLVPQRQTHLWIGRADFAEQALEDRAWAVLHRKRRVLVAPCDRVVI